MPKALADTPARKVKLTEIIVTARLGEVNMDKVREIAASVRRSGLLYPIVLWRTKRGLILVAGRHRLEAFRMLGETSIPAKIILCSTEEDARLIEIDDNICRNDLAALEIAIQLRIREDILLKKGMRMRGGGNYERRKYENRLTSADLAKAAGISTRLFLAYLQVAKGIPAELSKAILGTPLANHMSSLTEIARLTDRKVQRAAALLAAKLEDPSVNAVTHIISQEKKKLHSDMEFRPLQNRTTKASAEKLFIAKLLKIIAAASEKMAAFGPRESKRLKVAKDMVSQLMTVLELAGIKPDTPEDYASHFIKERRAG
jgi:ParB family chromosome partitioning protein